MKIFDKLFGDKNDRIDSIIENARKQVNQHFTGHLPRSYRVKLMQQIANPTTVNKIFFECAKKAFPIWEVEFEGVTPVYEILCKVDDFLYRDKGKKENFRILADEYRNYIEGQDGDAGAAALSALLLCYEIYCNAETILNLENYNGKDDDNAFEWDTAWTPDFCASLAVSGGSPFLKDGDIQKRKEFWSWFLDTVETFSQSSDKPLLPLKEIKENISEEQQLIRTQTYDTPEIQKIINLIIEKSIQLIDHTSIKWNKMILKSLNMKGGNLYDTYYIDENNEEKELDKGDRDVIQYFSDIKKSMYNQKPEEGSWLQSYLTIYPNGNFEFEFNYDNNETLLYYATDAEEQVYEFEGYPRAKEFTPDWWKKILGKKAKYLK